jgi:tetratricopeptide (TPR) repeat protein
VDAEDLSDRDLSAGAWLARARELERRGEFLRAYDVATRGLAEHPDDPSLRYRAVLLLARAGATRLAEQRYREYDLAGQPDEDSAALGARLAKDAALAEDGARRASLAAVAADRYEQVHDRAHGYFPGINAATMRLVGGDAARARDLARRVLGRIDRLPPAEGEETYYRIATRAEAHLLLGDVEAVRADLAEGLRQLGGDLAALATTRKQLRLICETAAIDPAVLDGFVAPKVVHFCGHMVAAPGAQGQLLAAGENAVAAAIRAHLGARRIGFAYGSLGAGADILFAEALLEHGAELHVALPLRRPADVPPESAPRAGVGRLS